MHVWELWIMNRKFRVLGTITVIVFLFGLIGVIVHKDKWYDIKVNFSTSTRQNKLTYAYKRTPPAKIPKIIHQIWNDDVIPTEYVDNVRSFVTLNKYPAWDYYFWTFELGRKLIKQKFPQLLDIYDCSDVYTKPDILRFVLIYHYGGAYFDLDVINIRALDSFVNYYACALTGAIPEHVLVYNLTAKFAGTNNAIFVCRPGHPFFKFLITRTVENWKTRPINITCPRPEFPVTLLAYLDKRSQYDVIPEIVKPHFFEPLYDLTVTKRLQQKCSSYYYKSLSADHKHICDNWKRLGEGDRTLHENSYTVHTWYHSSINPITRNPKNRIYKIVPHVKMFDVKTGEMT